MNPLLATDAYKVDHRRQYPEGTEYVYSNLTARSSRVEGVDYTVLFGLQRFCHTFLEDEFDKEFFEKSLAEVLSSYQRRLDALLGPDHGIDTDHIEALWNLGYLPIRICAVPEGTRVPLRVPMLTVENTLPEFFWLTNYIETVLSAALWSPITSATIADDFRNTLDFYAEKGGDESFTPFQGHDFSMRGMMGVDAAALSGAGHLLSFYGSDTLPAMELLEEHYYGGDSPIIGVSVAATEHSVMCAGGEEDELETYSRLLDLYPKGILSIVSDTWDLWAVLTDILPQLKDKIMARDGKLVIRPDSGDPADIICGTIRGYDPRHDKLDYKTPEELGVVELLWDVFGGTINEKGYRVLDSHVGAIYGDSINKARAKEINERLMAKGFAPQIVFGIGSYTYQFVTRDTFGMAMKATWVQINGEGKSIYKNPVTDNGVKKSARGRLAVERLEDDTIALIEDATKGQETHPSNLLQPVWEDGEGIGWVTLSDIRARLGH